MAYSGTCGDGAWYTLFPYVQFQDFSESVKSPTTASHLVLQHIATDLKLFRFSVMGDRPVFYCKGSLTDENALASNRQHVASLSQ